MTSPLMLRDDLKEGERDMEGDGGRQLQGGGRERKGLNPRRVGE